TKIILLIQSDSYVNYSYYTHTFNISFFNTTISPQLYTLSLHDALPISAFLLNRHSFPAEPLFRSQLTKNQAVATSQEAVQNQNEIGRAVQQECRDRARMPSSA